MNRPLLLTAVVAAAVACHSAPPPPSPGPSEHSLAGLAAQRVAVLPAYSVNPVGGVSIDPPAEILVRLNADIAAAFDERGINRARGWAFPADLEAAARHNSTYATDPRLFAEEPLRAPDLATDARLPDPLASQIRTLVALETDTRLVLAPVELKIERASGGIRGVLRVVLLDARLSNVRWVGEFASDVMPEYGPAITASIAARMAAAVAPL